MPALQLDAAHAALVVVDLRQGIAEMQTAPHSAPTLAANAMRMTDA